MRKYIDIVESAGAPTMKDATTAKGINRKKAERVLDPKGYFAKAKWPISEDEDLDQHPEEEALRSIEVLKALRPNIAAAAQPVYDAWDQDEDGYDEVYGSGGICQDIADAIANVLGHAGIDCRTVSATHEVHVYVVAKVVEGVYEVDIPHRVYERGAAYTWTKIPDVKFTADEVVLYCIDGNPENFAEYVEDDL